MKKFILMTICLLLASSAFAVDMNVLDNEMQRKLNYYLKSNGLKPRDKSPADIMLLYSDRAAEDAVKMLGLTRTILESKAIRISLRAVVPSGDIEK